MSIYIDSLYIPYSYENICSMRLTEVQKKVHDLLEEEKDILLHAPTGSGKTVSLLLSPFVSRYEIGGMIGLYPNNELLKNQMETVSEVVERFMNGVEESVKIRDLELKVYRIECRERGLFPDVERVVLLPLSSRYIVSGTGEPKSEIIYDIGATLGRLHSRGKTYVIVFTTPDTFLLIYTGSYMNFEYVGKALYNVLEAISNDDFDKIDYLVKRSLPRRLTANDVGFSERILDNPLFIDEFHLYGPYELPVLDALLRLFKEYSGKPVIFSSATPSRELIDELEWFDKSNLVEVRSRTSTRGDGFLVRGEVEVVPEPVETDRRGIIGFYKSLGHVVDIATDHEIVKELKGLSGRDTGLIIVDRLWMVNEVARRLNMNGIVPRCIASIYDETLCTDESNIIVGSESTTQGVNLGRVTLSVMGGVSAEDVIQRWGRVGRRVSDETSIVHLVLPEYALDENPPPKRTDYWGFTEWIEKVFPDYPKRKRDYINLLSEKTVSQLTTTRKKLVYLLGKISRHRVSGARIQIESIPISNHEASQILKRIMGPPETLARIIMFRRTGFTVKIRTPNNIIKETTIGIITRNFRPEGTIPNKGIIKISFEPARSRLSIVPRNLDIRELFSLSGKIMTIKTLLETLRGYIKITINGTSIRLAKNEISDDTLVYIVRSTKEITELLSYTGEGAKIEALGETLSAIFI